MKPQAAQYFVQEKVSNYWNDVPYDRDRFFIVRTPEHLQWADNALNAQSIVAADFETSGLRWYAHARAVGTAFTFKDGPFYRNIYIPFRHQTGEDQLTPEQAIPVVAKVLGNPKITKIWHNKKFDDHFARRDGINILGPQHDTMIQARLYDENESAKLKHRAIVDLGDPLASVHEQLLDRENARMAKGMNLTKKLFTELFGFALMPIGLCGVYAGQDTEFTYRLFEKYVDIPTFYPRIYKTEMALVRVLTNMEERGLPIDPEYFLGLKQRVQEGQEEIMKTIQSFGTPNINFGSDAELREYLQTGLHLPLRKLTKGGVFAVDEEVLSGFAEQHPVLQHILNWREAKKILSTYTDSILDRMSLSGLSHPDFQQVGTDTGRLACKEPNLQNVVGDSDDRAIGFCGKKIEDGGIDPWSVKTGFVVPKGYKRLYADYSQIELRVLGFYTGDPVMREVYLTGQDIHARTQLEIFGTNKKDNPEDRRRAKIVNFGLSYCMGAQGFARQAKIAETDAATFLDIFFKRYPRILPFREELWAYMRQNRCQSTNLFGRTRRLPALQAQINWERRRAERQAIGSLVQGTAAELTKEALVRMDVAFGELGIPAYPRTTIHDEIQVDVEDKYVKETAQVMKTCMESFPEFNPIPIVVDFAISDTDWSHKKKYELA